MAEGAWGSEAEACLRARSVLAACRRERGDLAGAEKLARRVLTTRTALQDAAQVREEERLACGRQWSVPRDIWSGNWRVKCA